MTLVRTMRAMRLLNAAILGNVNGAQMQTLLADQDRLTQWQQLLTQRGQMRRMASSQTAMTAVAASSTAMAAVAASSTAMNAVIASSTAMNAVIASSTAMAAVAASSTAMNAIRGSVALPLSSIPAMTSSSAPSGVVGASSQYSSSYAAWMAFDRGSGWWDTASANMINQWLSYSFPTPRFVHTLELTPGTEGGPTKWRLEYSDDGATWVTALSVPAYTPVANNKTTHSVAVVGKHAHWRLFAETATSYCSVNEMQLLGFQ